VHSNAKLIFARYAAPYFSEASRVLEIGPDTHPSTLSTLVPTQQEWHTLDIVNRADDLTYVTSDPYAFPIEDGRYDIVLSSQVIEHVERIWLWMKEVVRVTRPGGMVITIAPVSWPHHEGPEYGDCWRMYPAGLSALCEDSGLFVESSHWGSLETPPPRRVVPGRSQEWLSRRGQRVSRVMELLGLPVERGFDTIVVGRKSA